MEAAALPSPAAVASRSTLLPAAVLRLRSDEQLVALFRAGSDAAFSVIHDRYRARLLAYSRQMLGGSHADAEDVLQDVFVRAHAALRAGDSPITLRAWLYRIAHNRCVDGLRRPAPMPAEIMPGALPALSRGTRHDPPAEAELSEDLRRLVRDLLALPEQQRSALLMRELQGLSYEELASSLGVSVSAVKSLLVRARGGVLSAAVARDAPCPEIRLELAAAHDRGVRPSGQARRHLRECAGCRQHRLELRSTSRQLAALVPPVGLLGQIGLLSGLGAGGGTGGGLAASGGGVALCGVAGATVGKVAAIVCAAALVTDASGAFAPGRQAARQPIPSHPVSHAAATPPPILRRAPAARFALRTIAVTPVAPTCPPTAANAAVVAGPANGAAGASPDRTPSPQSPPDTPPPAPATATASTAVEPGSGSPSVSTQTSTSAQASASSGDPSSTQAGVPIAAPPASSSASSSPITAAGSAASSPAPGAPSSSAVAATASGPACSGPPPVAAGSGPSVSGAPAMAPAALTPTGSGSAPTDTTATAASLAGQSTPSSASIAARAAAGAPAAAITPAVPTTPALVGSGSGSGAAPATTAGP